MLETDLADIQVVGLGKDWDLSLDVRLPISQRALDGHSDTYEHGPMVRLGLSRSIGP